MNTAQKAAIKALEAAFLLLARSNMVMVGVDDNLIVTVEDDELEREVRNSSSCEAVFARDNRNHPGTTTIKTRGVYRDSGGA